MIEQSKVDGLLEELSLCCGRRLTFTLLQHGRAVAAVQRWAEREMRQPVDHLKAMCAWSELLAEQVGWTRDNAASFWASRDAARKLAPEDPRPQPAPSPQQPNASEIPPSKLRAALCESAPSPQQGSDAEIKRLRDGLALIATDEHRLMNITARQTAQSILDGKPIYSPAPPEPKPAQDDIVTRLVSAQVASCGCIDVKTPDHRFHPANCLYRVLADAIEAIQAKSAPPPAKQERKLLQCRANGGENCIKSSPDCYLAGGCTAAEPKPEQTQWRIAPGEPTCIFTGDLAKPIKCMSKERAALVVAAVNAYRSAPPLAPQEQKPAQDVLSKFDLAFEIMRLMDREESDLLQSCHFGYVLRVQREQSAPPPAAQGEKPAQDSTKQPSVPTFSFDGEGIYQMFGVTGDYVRTDDYRDLHEALQMANAERDRWYAAAQSAPPPANPDAEKLLGELLAVIHRDGGHYREQHGTAKAVEDAIAKWGGMVRLVDAAKPKLRRCAATMGFDPPQDCDAPFCGCNPAWHDCIEMLRETGLLIDRNAPPAKPDEQIDHAIRRIDDRELSMDDSEGIIEMLKELKARRQANPDIVAVDHEGNAVHAMQAAKPDEKPLGAETRAATSRGAHSTEDAGRPQPTTAKPGDGIKCTDCNGSGKETQVYDEQSGWSNQRPCETCGGSGRITTVEQYLKTLPANWHEDSSLETWFPITAEELARLKTERSAQPLAEAPVCSDELQLIFEHGEPKGIRDRAGYLCHFNSVPKFEGQEERYQKELAQRARLADFLLRSLQRNVNAVSTAAPPAQEDQTEAMNSASTNGPAWNLLREIDDYLGRSPMEAIHSGSTLHRKITAALYETPRPSRLETEEKHDIVEGLSARAWLLKVALSYTSKSGEVGYYNFAERDLVNLLHHVQHISYYSAPGMTHDPSRLEFYALFVQSTDGDASYAHNYRYECSLQPSSQTEAIQIAREWGPLARVARVTVLEDGK